jgi:aspartyl protease family protein
LTLAGYSGAMRLGYLIIILIGVLIGVLMPSDVKSVKSEPLTSVDRVNSLAARRTIMVPPRANALTNAPATGGPWTTLERGPGGHFYADAQVNGMSVHFLVDTGASGVALTVADAQRVGLQFSPSEFTAVGRGASGEVRGKLITLDRVTLNGRTVENVSGAIIEGGDTSLLGQSFLTRMGTLEMSGERMTIR